MKGQLKKLEDALARAKDPEDAIEEFRKLKDNAENPKDENPDLTLSTSLLKVTLASKET